MINKDNEEQGTGKANRHQLYLGILQVCLSAQISKWLADSFWKHETRADVRRVYFSNL